MGPGITARTSMSRWLMALRTRRGEVHTIVAFANKLARIGWAVLQGDQLMWGAGCRHYSRDNGRALNVLDPLVRDPGTIDVSAVEALLQHIFCLLLTFLSRSCAAFHRLNNCRARWAS